MKRLQIATLCASLLALLTVVLPAAAQTSGPANPGFSTGPTGPGTMLGNAPGQFGDLLTEQNFPQFLRNMGLNPQEQLVGGKRYFVVQKDGWNFVLQLRAVRNQTGAIVGYDVYSPLGSPLANPGSVPAQRWQRLLGANGQNAPCSFVYVESERQVYLVLNYWGNQVRQQTFSSDVNFLLRTIQNTRPVWGLTGF